ncbi:MAG: magnesium-translocating P-type ATPase [Candidatus Rokuibacteriota bacterium]|nr:MAG: magnesium-translocating P-type ATPase [Candidatus Rokubacteria bacterium]
MSLEQALDRCGGSERGLSSAEAAIRLGRWGPNEVEPPRRFAALRELGRYLANPLVLILLVASGVSAAFGQVVSAVIIGLMLALSVLLNFTQAYRSQRAALALRARVGQTASVLRDGTARDVPARQVVPGDLIRLAAGDLVAADARLVLAKDLFVNEAALTGESLPREKHAQRDGTPGASVVDAENAVFRGTSVVSGVGAALVMTTGVGTEFGRVAAVLTARPPETEFERGTRRFGFFILQVVVFLVLFVFFVNALIRRDVLESFLFSVALAVGLTPELLPMIVSVTLASGAVRMARKKVIVKQLAAIENFGSMDILCSDKTGTLTLGQITVDRHVNLRGENDETVIRLAALNSVYQTGLKSPMDDAILGHEHPAVARYSRVDEIPFDFERRRVSVVVEDGGGRLLIVKGAPESVLPVCAEVELDGALKPLDAAARATAAELFRELSSDGYRALAVAYRQLERRPAYTVADERDLVFVGFAAFLDPPHEGVAETLAALGADGVQVKIITGDNELVTKRICVQVGLDAATVVLGHEVERMSDPALAAVAERTSVFARVSPIQKNRIVRALRSRGHVVGCLGDGINDAPALRSADVGISVENAVDVARDAADIILLEKRLAVLHDGVMEGRRSFGNIMKYVLMGTSSNFGNMLSMAAASLFLPFLPMLPLQILLNNFLYDLSQVAIPADSVDSTYMVKPKRWNVTFIRRFMLLIGPLSSLYDFATFAVMLGVFHAGEPLFRAGWFVESLATQTLVIFVIRTADRPWASRPSRALAWGVGSCATAGALLPFTPVATWLGFAPLPPLFFAFLLFMVVSYLALVEVVKRWFYRHYPM